MGFILLYGYLLQIVSFFHESIQELLLTLLLKGGDDAQPGKQNKTPKCLV
jgi:hypothetical protein